MKGKLAITVMREEIFKRDKFRCISCGAISISPDTDPETYFELEKALPDGMALTLGHLNGHHKKIVSLKEGWKDLGTQCSPCNIGQTKAIRTKCLKYTSKLKEKGTRRFEAALGRRDAEADASKATRKASKPFWRVKKGPKTSKWSNLPGAPRQKLH